MAGFSFRTVKVGDDYGECQKIHSHLGGKADGCQGFKLDHSSTFASSLICQICGCHQNYHRKVAYSKCNKIHDLKNPNSVDGCQEFIPAGRDSNNLLKCAGCGCHRSFHGNHEVTTKQVGPTASSGSAAPRGLKSAPLGFRRP